MAFCGKCGSEIGNDNVFCPKCGALQEQDNANQENAQQQDNYSSTNYQQPNQQSNTYQPYNQQNNSYGNYNKPQYQPQQQPVDNTGILVWSILTALLCCTPLGIAAIVFSTQAKKAVSLEEAQSKLKNAKLMCIIGDVVGVIILIISFMSGLYEALM
jgi:uncharacterized membrane protein YvbJ